MRNALLAIGAIAAAGLLGWGGYVLNERRQCQALEDEYLNNVSEAKQNILLKSIAPEREDLAKVADELEEARIQAAEQLLPRIYTECGAPAGRTASRKGSELPLGG